MRKVFTLSIVAMLSLFSTTVSADSLADLLEGKTVEIGDALQTVSEIQQGQWYVIARQYVFRVYDDMYIFDNDYSDAYGKVYFWVWDATESNPIYTGMSATEENALRTLVRFIPISVDGFEGDTYYLQFASGKYVAIQDAGNNFVRTLEDIDNVAPVYVYNALNTDAHFGIYSTQGTMYSLNGVWSQSTSIDSTYVISNWPGSGSTTLNGSNDFAIFPAVTFTEEELLSTAYAECVSIWTTCTEFLPAAQEFGCYDAGEQGA